MQEGVKKNDRRQLSTRQRTTLESRIKIVEAAAACFIEQGFHQTSIRDIASKARVSTGNLYNHFKGKTELIAEISALEADDMVDINAILSIDEDANVAVSRFVAAYFDYLSRPENTVLAAEITAEAFRNPEIAKPFLQNRAATVKRLCHVLEASNMPSSIPSSETAETLITLIEGTATRVAFDTNEKKKTSLATLTAVTNTLLGF